MMVSLVKAEEEEEAKCMGSIKHAGRDGLQWVVELGRKAAKLVEINVPAPLSRSVQTTFSSCLTTDDDQRCC